MSTKKPASKTRKPKDVAPLAVAFGERSDNVRALQTFLRDHGYAVDDVEGSFDNYTRNAVSMFQEANGLPMTGHWTEADSAATGDLLAQGNVVAFEA
jgi:peptidoglycan hydrolase-like protein with peptidoglycan-binding domain